jgi:transcriptional regulator with XRE-family HTH domain
MGDNSEVRRIMSAAGCTYREMRAATGLSTRTIAKAMRDPWTVRCQTLCRMAEHLGVGLADLLPASRRGETG